MTQVHLRHELPTDHRTVEELTREAFWNLQVPGCDEHYLVHHLRRHADYLPELSFVAEVDGRIVGHVATTRSVLVSDTRELSTITMGPISVHPEFQRRGIGRAMVEKVCDEARARGFAAVVILGHPHNYVGYGFRNGKDLGIAMEDGSHPLGLLAMELSPGSTSRSATEETTGHESTSSTHAAGPPGESTGASAEAPVASHGDARWKVRFSDAYDVPRGLEAFDATFPPRTKEWKPTQELYSMAIRAHLK